MTTMRVVTSVSITIGFGTITILLSICFVTHPSGVLISSTTFIIMFISPYFIKSPP